MPISAVQTDANFIQRNLIPEESHYVRYVMQKASEFGSRKNFFSAHLISVMFATAAVAMSAINVISYLLQAPVRVLLHLVQFDPIALVANFVIDLSDVARSLLFVSLGATFIVAGFLFPAPLFNHFSPQYYESREVRLEQKLNAFEKKNKQLEAKIKELDEVILVQRSLILDRDKQKKVEQI